MLSPHSGELLAASPDGHQPLQPIPAWIGSDPVEHPKPPAVSRLQELPFGEITWDDFERLCLRLARLASDVEYSCRPYGTAGQFQGGIDLYARHDGASKYVVYQCKRENDFGPAKISAAVTTFLNGNWRDRAGQLVLCTKEDLRTSQRTEEVERQIDLLKHHGITFTVWDATELNQLLKMQPLIVDDFFGRHWVEAFCGSDALAAVSKRIDGPAAATVRASLRQLYSAVLKIDDPGLPLAAEASNYLPLEQRYVVPDILSPSYQSETSLSESIPLSLRPDILASSAEPLAGEPEQSGQPATVAQERRRPSRQSVDQWLKDNRQTVILAGPGMGKSSLVRFLAMDVLSEAPRLAALDKIHRNCLPVVIPFGFWTALIGHDLAIQLSLEDVIEKWLHQLGSHQLWPAVKAALNDERLLLLVDGADEYHSESAAGAALKQLRVFVELRKCPAILTSRPAGFQRLPAFSGDWAVANLAPFTRRQQLDFISTWTRFHLSSSGNPPEQGLLDAQSAAVVERIEDEIARNSGLSELAETPLLLGILVFLNRSNLPLPHDRFQAYQRMVQHLISEHPQARRVAASLTADNDLLDPDSLRSVLAALAYEITRSRPNGGIEHGDAVKAIKAFLRDDAIGFGYDAASALKTAQQIVAASERTVGLLVEKASGLCTFIHRAFQEHLCAVYINALELDEQLKLIGERAADPQWREVILGIAHLTSRPADVRRIVECINSVQGDLVATFQVETMLCEIATGPFQCPSSLCTELCNRFFEIVETGPWLPHRRALLRLLLAGVHAPKVKQMLRSRLKGWYPSRSLWRSSLLPDLACSGQRVHLDLLFRGLHDEAGNNSMAAASAIAEHCRNEGDLGRLLAMLAGPCSLPTLCAVVTALFEGWIFHPIWDVLEETLRRAHSIELRLLAIRRRIRTGRQDESDLAELMWSISNGGPYSWRGGSGIENAIVEGWPGDIRIRDAAITCLSPRARFRGGIGSEPAARLLIEGYSRDVIATTALAQLIQTEEHAFTDSHHTWKAISMVYQGDAQMIAAADVWMEKWSKHRYPEVSFAARLGWTPTAKKTLIVNLAGSFPFWSADALVEGWGVDDSEVSGALTQLLSSEYAPQIAHLFPRLIPDRETCFSMLMNLLSADHSRDAARVLEALAESMQEDERADVLAAGLKWVDRPQIVGARDQIVGVLLKHFRSEPKVLEIARAEMKRRDGCWSAVLAEFPHDAEIGAAAVEMAAPLPKELRSEIVNFLSLHAHGDSELLAFLRLFDHEADPSMKTSMAIAYCRSIARSHQPLAELVSELQNSLVCGGFDFESRRQAAFCGLDTLGKIDLVRSTRTARQDPIPIPVAILGNPNEPFIVHLLSNWQRLRKDLGDTFSTTFTRSADLDDLYWWSEIADFVDEYPEPRNALLALLEETRGYQLYSELLFFLARHRPKSGLLREHCLNVVRDHGQSTSRWLEIQAAAFLLGRDFYSDDTVLTALVTEHEQNPWHRENILWALCEGWPSHEIVEKAYSTLKARQTPSGIIGVETIVEMLLVCRKTPSAELIEVLAEFVSRARGDMIYHAGAFTKPIVRRLAGDAELQAILLERLKATDNPSERVSFAGLLIRAVGLIEELKNWALSNIAAPEATHFYSSVGFDLTTGTVRTVWDKSLEVLQSS